MSRYYTKAGEPMHWVPKKDGTGNRPTTIADARKLGLLPSVTTCLKILEKPALKEWLIRQAVHAVVTAPDVPGEGIDAKITRVLEDERQQDEESRIARDLGSEIHEALALAVTGKSYPAHLAKWIEEPINEIDFGEVLSTETVLVGDGYGGVTDLIMRRNGEVWLIDWKSAKTLPKKDAWPEHRLQLAAYAKAASAIHPFVPIRTANIYISTVEPGKFIVCEHPAWQPTYEHGFRPLLEVWKWMNNYDPNEQKDN